MVKKMIKFGKGVVKCRFLILILAFLLLIPSAIGYMKTRINYDILSYLPGQIETMKGQDILLDEFGTGAFSFVVVEGMQDKDLQKIADKIEDVPHVKNVIWYGSIMDFSIPREALPDDIYNFFNNKDADSQLMAVLFDESMSSDGTMDAIQTINDLVGKQCFVSGMASVNNDIRKLAENESVIYVLIAVVLSLIVLSLTMDSVVVPFLFLISIGMAIIYNLGSNVFFGEISYITKALAAVLQLGLGIDYAIIMCHHYTEERELFAPREATIRALTLAIPEISASSLTTISGLLALSFMKIKIGEDMSLVLIKSILFLMLTVFFLMPALIMYMSPWIDKTHHRKFLPRIDALGRFAIRSRYVVPPIFLVIIIAGFVLSSKCPYVCVPYTKDELGDGLGCNACGVTGCRIIDSPRERLIAMLTNSLVPCNGRFPLLITLLTAFLSGEAMLGASAGLLASLVLSVCVTLLVSRLLSATLLRGEGSAFSLELPPYRMPTMKASLTHTWSHACQPEYIWDNG